MVYVRFATRIDKGVNRRLRMFALLEGRPLSHTLSALLDRQLPSADELAARLGGGNPGEAAS